MKTLQIRRWTKIAVWHGFRGVWWWRRDGGEGGGGGGGRVRRHPEADARLLHPQDPQGDQDRQALHGNPGNNNFLQDFAMSRFTCWKYSKVKTTITFINPLVDRIHVEAQLQGAWTLDALPRHGGGQSFSLTNIMKYSTKTWGWAVSMASIE